MRFVLMCGLALVLGWAVNLAIVYDTSRRKNVSFCYAMLQLYGHCVVSPTCTFGTENTSLWVWLEETKRQTRSGR